MDWTFLAGIDIGSRKLAVASCMLSMPSQDVHYVDQVDVRSIEISTEVTNQPDVWHDLEFWLEDYLEEVGAGPGVSVRQFYFIEEPPYVRSHRTMMLLSGTFGMASTVCAHGGKTSGVIVQEWKKEVIGKGNATKEEVAQSVKERWGQAAALSQDELDALAIMTYGINVVKRARSVRDELSV